MFAAAVLMDSPATGLTETLELETGRMAKQKSGSRSQGAKTRVCVKHGRPISRLFLSKGNREF